MKYSLFNKIYINLQQFQVIPEKKKHKETYKVPNICDKNINKAKL